MLEDLGKRIISLHKRKERARKNKHKTARIIRKEEEEEPARRKA